MHSNNIGTSKVHDVGCHRPVLNDERIFIRIHDGCASCAASGIRTAFYTRFKNNATHQSFACLANTLPESIGIHTADQSQISHGSITKSQRSLRVYRATRKRNLCTHIATFTILKEAFLFNPTV